MNREQMIEKAARVMCDKPQDSLPRWDSCDSGMRRLYIEEATAVVDALLPQVTTVEELEALPGPALLLGAPVGKFPAVFKWTNGQLYYADGLRVPNLGAEFGTLTVVWQP